MLNESYHRLPVVPVVPVVPLRRRLQL